MSWNFDEALSYYRSQGAPSDQNALKNLLTEIQQEQGGSVPAWALPRISAAYGVKETFLAAVIKRYPSLHLQDGTHLLEVCGGSGCTKRGHLAEFVEKTYGASPDGFAFRVTPCMHMCGQGPMIRWDGEIHCGADEALIRSLVEGCAAAGGAAEPEKPQKESKPEKKSPKPEKKEKDRDKKESKDRKKDEKKDHKDKKEKKKDHRD